MLGMTHQRMIFCAALLAAGPAMADYTGPTGKTVDCYCTDKQGARVELGQTICMQVDGRLFMAQCQMSLNVPMWREVSQGCMSSDLQLSEPPVQSLAIDTHI